MPILSARQAAEIARGVYDLRTQTVADALKTGIGTDGMFAVDDGKGLKSSTGAKMFRTLTNFGYIARGIGPYRDEVLIATRGTDIPADWVTNLNIGMQFGPSNLLVHAGFNETWKGFLPELRNFFRTHRPTRIHCVGHSLGGALAALNADYCSDQGIAKVELYTFGAPRAGDGVFARSLTQRLGKDSIRRVSHPADPVPMIPLFPFWHLPFAKPGLTIAKTSNWPISFNAHRMQASYIPGVADVDWKALGHGDAPADDAAQVKNWLERTADGKGSILMGSATVLSMIGKALAWLTAAAGRLVAGSVGITLATGFTVLDQVAWLLTKGAQLAREIGVYVGTLMATILRFLGRKAVQTAEVTSAFLRWVLELLFSSLRNVAQRALRTVL